MKFDREAVRAANRLEDLIPTLTGHPISHNGTRELVTRCPWHEDEHPSLRVNAQKQQWFCDVCTVGGDVFAFVARHQRTDFAGALLWLAERARVRHEHARARKIRRIVETYDYRDETGELLFQTVRYDPKDFRQRQPDGNGGWIWNLKGVRLVLYGLPELKGQDGVAICAGEKDALAIRALGLPATTNPLGEGKWRDEYTQQLIAAGVKRVTIFPDNDDPGRAHADAVARSCHAAGLQVRLVWLPHVPPKGDVSDYLTTHTKHELLALVKAAPMYELASAPPIEHDEALAEPPAAIVPGEPVNLAALLDDVMTFVRRFVVLSQDQAVAVTLWVAHTYVIDAYDVTPYLNVESATPRAGKTRLFEVLALIAANAWFTARTSAAALVRKIDMIAPTLLYDERDATFRGDPEFAETLRGILNSGYKRGGASSQCVGVGAAMTVKDFQTFCPKAIAGIGALPDTVADRSIPIVLRRRLKTEPVEKFKARRVRPHAAPLAQRLAAWVHTAVPILRDAEPIELDLDNDRAEEVWEPLLAVAALAGQDWLVQALAAARALSGSRDINDETIGVQLLTDIRKVFRDEGDPAALATKTIKDGLCAMEDRPWATFGNSEKPITGHALAKCLADFQVVPAGDTRFGDKVLKSYRRAAFEDAWSRYLPIEAQHRNNANEHGHETAVSQGLHDETVADAKSPVSADEHGACCGVALEKPDRGGPEHCSSFENAFSGNNDGVCSTVPLPEGEEWEQAW